MKNLILTLLITLPFIGSSQAWHEEVNKYTYDNLNRLIQVEYSDSTLKRYVYDNLGNRITLSVTAPPSSTVGITVEDLKNTIIVYPNPTFNNITIGLPDTLQGKELAVEIYSMDGKKVYSKSIKNSTKSLSVSASDFVSGVYFLKVTEGTHSWNQLFIKK